MDEYYPGYEALSSYLKKFDNPSYRNFLDLNREEVIKSPPFTENWGGLESAWSNRFIRAVQTHIPDRFEDIKLKVEAECRNRGLKLYWDEILREREKNNVREIHITGSLKLLGASGRRNIQELLTDGTILPKQDMDDLPKPELLHRDVPQVEEGVNDVEDENQVDTSEESEEDRPKINKTAFHEAHKSIPDSSKMRLSTGKIVEDVLFDFCRNMDYEHHAHSYIIDCDDAEIKSLYTETEWKELIKDRLGLPINPAHIAKELSKYAKKTLRELRQIVMTPYLQDDIEYDAQQHYDMEWIQTSLRTLTNLYENTDHPLARSHYEDWTDAPSLASANRKNRAKLTNERKFTGRKIDGIIYIIDRLLEIIMMNNLNIIRGIQENNANPESEETSFLDELTGVVHLSQPPTPPSLIQFFADNEKTPKKAKINLLEKLVEIFNFGLRIIIFHVYHLKNENLNLDDNSQIKKENEILKVEVSRINDSLEKYKLIADNQLKDFKNKLKEKDEKYQFLRM
ncbi:hypothetical protein GLOIN_2v1838532 [Rhizophagus irregularis DAOM 181602=DAOM 197198]|uniref:Uncharacterized protein n=1 Tax=Rhizophagus irregularis (strain DAOM 181602 / DAOM 197198 / MUCL 43194) TaxID=747089 RepID=A0A2P4QDU8_RHIID|nr:hypothetical protein GLOIN_2v1838532 [Rhizophagus irregularis DAOM 181602=DAOM 197198]POG75804.1 hypothetical protein GLOIN_2v1838532 [Rhizophagus irregularis DAOM 181602=DAOM 197198]|eukprot:XP_025182670.1 hypothetical protein GLOIN_2v1838532 [Rhizophagus irregularis DAOM 181602=DAOM 197198]